jgi:regulator of replication initiation timing
MEDFESLSEKLARITEDCDRLRGENSRLRELLGQQTTQLEKPGLKPKASPLN